MIVFDIWEDMNERPDYYLELVKTSQDSRKPKLGMSIEFGLFGSAEWRQSIESGKIEKRKVMGQIIECFEAGQDNSGIPNTIRIVCEDGSLDECGMYTSGGVSENAYRVGTKIEATFLLHPLKAKDSNGRPVLIRRPYHIEVFEPS